MNKLVYQSIKVTLATVLAILIAELLNLHYSTTAGVIAMLSVLDTRKQSMIVGVKRLGAASLGVVLAIVLFNLLGHRLWVLGIFLMIFIPLLTWFRSTEALAVATVLVTHIYSINTTEPWIFINELVLLFIGVLIGWLLNLHMLNIEDEIKKYQFETEANIKEVLRKMKYQLLNQCSIDEQEDLLDHLDQLIREGMAKAIQFNNNHLLRDDSYFHKYFMMRREQYYVLKHMQTYFHVSFIAVAEAERLSVYTEKLADELNECNDGMALMTEFNSLREHYRQSALPVTREEFEKRATLFQYMNDLAYFKRIKMAFMVEYGDIKYC